MNKPICALACAGLLAVVGCRAGGGNSGEETDAQGQRNEAWEGWQGGSAPDAAGGRVGDDGEER